MLWAWSTASYAVLSWVDASRANWTYQDMSGALNALMLSANESLSHTKRNALALVDWVGWFKCFWSWTDASCLKIDALGLVGCIGRFICFCLEWMHHVQKDMLWAWLIALGYLNPFRLGWMHLVQMKCFWNALIASAAFCLDECIMCKGHFLGLGRHKHKKPWYIFVSLVLTYIVCVMWWQGASHINKRSSVQDFRGYKKTLMYLRTWSIGSGSGHA